MLLLKTEHLRHLKEMQSSKLFIWKEHHLSIDGIPTGVPFLPKIVYKKVRGWTSRVEPPCTKTLLSTPPLALISLIVLFHLYVKSIHKGPKWKTGWDNDEVNFLSKDQLTKKKDRILIKNLISNKWKYKTKEARLILQF